ncbi:hypothetical protein NEICINOT_04912 [Neisseria cinerea ATCC 14685]|uniref:Uncharacterized protein n=1 Tax=Neisseria cinerea ATCC 14685 TaxID=546262 RepID=D0W5E9_NEICI|nr:hypothetical protein NEICINOT_04912 [Neisseria cinerea ATCC 14685]
MINKFIYSSFPCTVKVANRSLHPTNRVRGYATPPTCGRCKP